MTEFEGTSEKGDFQEALQLALRSALESKARSQTDSMVSYVVKEIRGVRGGIANFNKLTVVVTVR
jgi:hypothetical protein